MAVRRNVGMRRRSRALRDPPFALPGTPENKEWTEHAIRALQGLLDFILLKFQERRVL
jgi:hypothetical protein